MNFIEVLLQLQNQVRICHWQTDKYSVHKATDKLYNNLDSTIDTFVEQFMGKYGKIRSEKGFSLQLKNIDENNALFPILSLYLGNSDNETQEDINDIIENNFGIDNQLMEKTFSYLNSIKFI